MHQFSFLLKSYSTDFQLATQLISSYNRFNRDNIPLFMVVPDEDIKLFEIFLSETIKLIPESTFENHILKHGDLPISDSVGYRNQSIIKLAFWELQFSQFYMCLDSDGKFIKDFYISDFMFSPQQAYTVLVEDRELQLNTDYYHNFWVGRQSQMNKILEFLECHNRIYLTCHGFQIISSNVMSDFKREILTYNNLSYKDILNISPYEFSWYNYFLQKKEYHLYVREPYFKTIHISNQVLNLIINETTEKVLSRSYLGYVFNSNFYVNPLPLDLNSSKSYLVAKFLPSKILLASIFYKLLIILSMFYRNKFKLKNTVRW